jgi:uncharacterized membrane protein
MGTVAIMTILCILSATIGMCFLEGDTLRFLLKLIGTILWCVVTLGWWFYFLVDKYIP